MRKNEKIEFGKTYYPKSNDIIISEDLVKGNGWSIKRTGKNILFEFIAARHGGGSDVYQITEVEFSQIKSGMLTYLDLIKKYAV